jgi:hypothetical protein
VEVGRSWCFDFIWEPVGFTPNLAALFNQLGKLICSPPPRTTKDQHWGLTSTLHPAVTVLPSAADVALRFWGLR